MTIAAQTGEHRHDESRPVQKQRIDRAELYMETARLFSKRSTCSRGHVGCVAVRDNRIVCAGYNGSPPGMPHCLDVGCGGGAVVHRAQLDSLPGGEMPRPAEAVDHVEFPNGCTRAIHAEANMVAFAARTGVSLEGCAVFSTCAPCLPCAQVLVASGIACLWYEMPYRLPEGLQLVDQANIEIRRYPDDCRLKR